MSEPAYDAILVVSFGGPEGRNDVIPFLENVLRGRNVPRERMLEVAEHYYHFDGVSPINQQCRDLIAALRTELDNHAIDIPIVWGNRNWKPFLTDTVRQLHHDGKRRVLAYVTSAYSSWSGCRQYRGNIDDALRPLGDTAPQIDKLRVFYNHPDFIAANCDVLREAIDQSGRVVEESYVVFTAHSIPNSMADSCDYEKQLSETCRLVADATGIGNWDLVYQSRSGRPQDPWLEPDILEHIKDRHSVGLQSFVIAPIGFLSDHMEVLYDLDCEAKELCDQLGIEMHRAATVGTNPHFVTMLRKLIQERINQNAERESIGQFPPHHDTCPTDCCPLISGRMS